MLYMNSMGVMFVQSKLICFTDQSRRGADDNIMIVEHGDTCKIPVQLQGMCTNITWYRTPFGGDEHDKQQIDLTNISKWQNGKVGMPSLTILNFTHSDIGIYMCYVNDGEEIRAHPEWFIDCKYENGQVAPIAFLKIVML